jgi:hypothetical protein
MRLATKPHGRKACPLPTTMTSHASPLHAAETVELTSAIGSSFFHVCETILTLVRDAEVLKKAAVDTMAQHDGAHQQYIISPH